MGADRALADVSEMVGGQQSVLGPVISVPYSRTFGSRHEKTIYGYAVAYAEMGTASANVNVDMRTRGIHTIPVFDASIRMDAVFDPDVLRAALPEDATPVWSDARIYLGVSDTRGIRDAITVKANGTDVSIEPTPYLSRNKGDYNPVPASGVTLAGGHIPRP